MTHTTLATTTGLAGILPSGAFKTLNGLTTGDITIKDEYDIGTACHIINNTLMNAIETTPDDQIIVVNIGEYHDAPTHVLLAACTLWAAVNIRDNNKDNTARNFIYAKELPYDVLNDCSNELIELPLKSDACKNDTTGHLTLRTLMADNRYDSPLTNNAVYNIALERGITTCFIDAADKDKGTYLNPSDPLAVKYAQEMFNINLHTQNLYSESQKKPDESWDTRGMDVRNRVMVKRALTAAHDNEARIIIIHGGMAHNHGYKREDLPYQTSLSALFTNAGARVINILADLYVPFRPGVRINNTVPDEAWVHHKDDLIFRGLSSRVYASFGGRHS